MGENGKRMNLLILLRMSTENKRIISEYFETAEKYWEAGQYEEAFKWYRLAAEQGDAVAQFNVGTCYFGGEGVE